MTFCVHFETLFAWQNVYKLVGFLFQYFDTGITTHKRNIEVNMAGCTSVYQITE